MAPAVVFPPGNIPARNNVHTYVCMHGYIMRSTEYSEYEVLKRAERDQCRYEMLSPNRLGSARKDVILLLFDMQKYRRDTVAFLSMQVVGVGEKP